MRIAVDSDKRILKLLHEIGLVVGGREEKVVEPDDFSSGGTW
jgi:hypothetical protein